ncbi:MAG: hypothetical protein WAV16_02060 [Candidatus Moraniibacteriota bacterium]
MKLVGPLHSESARGTFGGVLTFSERESGSQVRYQRKQKDKITPSRTAQRNKFIQAKNIYHLQDFGIIEFGYNMVGGGRVAISDLPLNKRAPQFARFVSDVLNFYK